MLNQVLLEIELARNGLNLSELSHKLDIDQSALDGMIQFWVQKGRLVDDDVEEGDSCSTIDSCGRSCTGKSTCAFAMKMPKTYSIANRKTQNNERI